MAKGGIASQKTLAMTIGNLTLEPIKYYYVYIMTSRHNRVLYTGVTNDIIVRASQHKEKSVKGFTKRYNVTKLVFYEIFDDIDAAIAREKQIKGGSRQRKVALIEAMNPKWRDLYDTL